MLGDDIQAAVAEPCKVDVEGMCFERLAPAAGMVHEIDFVHADYPCGGTDKQLLFHVVVPDFFSEHHDHARDVREIAQHVREAAIAEAVEDDLGYGNGLQAGWVAARGNVEVGQQADFWRVVQVLDPRSFELEEQYVRVQAEVEVLAAAVCEGRGETHNVVCLAGLITGFCTRFLAQIDHRGGRTGAVAWAEELLVVPLIVRLRFQRHESRRLVEVCEGPDVQAEFLGQP